MAASLKTSIGKVRNQNEDAAWMDEEKHIFAVADGMGGHLAGEVASEMAVRAVERMAAEHNAPTFSVLTQTVRAADEAIYRHAAENPECFGMGTTLSMAWHSGHYMYIAHVGDSRIYRLRDKTLVQITQDHSLVAEMVRAGIITPEQARIHPRRNIITRALGTGGDNEPDILVADTQKGDVWLLCSDGLTGMVEDEDIERTLCRFGVETAAETLLRLALNAGGRDNITLIVYQDEEE